MLYKFIKLLLLYQAGFNGMSESIHDTFLCVFQAKHAHYWEIKLTTHKASRVPTSTETQCMVGLIRK